MVESTGGSTGSSLAYVCAAKGYRLRVVSSDAFAEAKLKTMAAFGAELTVIPSEGHGITSELINRVIDQARRFAAEPGTYSTDQLNNRDVLVGYREVGRELLEQVDGPIDVLARLPASRVLRDLRTFRRVVVSKPSPRRRG